MKWIIYYDPEKKELIDFPWDDDRPIPPLIRPKLKNGTHKKGKNILTRHPNKRKKGKKITPHNE